LVRTGSSFTAFASPDGVNWSQVGSAQTITMAPNVFIGLAISSNDNTLLTTATFDNVSITLPPPSFALAASPSSLSVAQGTSGTSAITATPQNGFTGTVSLSVSGLPAGVTATLSPTSITGTSASTLTLAASSTATPGAAVVTITGTSSSPSGSLTKTTTVSLTVVSAPLPSGWADIDIGPVGPAGSVSFSNGTFTVIGSGQYVWSIADGFNFAYQALSGDGAIVARVLSASGGAPGQSVGLMIRETLTPGSTNAYALFSGNAQIYLTDRNATGGLSSSAGNTTPVTLPYWIKLVRTGSSFSAFASPDGVNWSQVGSAQTIAMAPNVFIGLAISSNDNTLLTTATFDNVSITSPPPSFALAASPSSLSVAQGTSGTSAITATPQNVFTGTVSLSVSGLPNGVIPTFSPASTMGSSTLTLTASTTATTGTFPLTITGTSGSLSNTTPLSLTVVMPPSYSLSASPNSLTVTQGASGTSTVTINPLNGFTGSVSLSASGLPAGVTPTFSPASTTGSSILTLAASSAA